MIIIGTGGISGIRGGDMVIKITQSLEFLHRYIDAVTSAIYGGKEPRFLPQFAFEREEKIELI